MDVAIIGGGPAGSYLAYCLSREGIGATVYDDSHPREKPCGGGISSFAMRKFPIICGMPGDKAPGKRMTIVSPSGREAVIESPREDYCVSRRAFDGYLLRKAVDEGATLKRERVTGIARGRAWKLRTAKGVREADLIVGADGVNSIVRRHVAAPFRKEDLCFCYGCFTEVTRELSELEGLMKFLDGTAGYVWIFPRAEDCSIGVGSGAEGIGIARKELESVISRYASGARILSRWGAMIPMGRTPGFFSGSAAGDGWMLVGDAAGHVNPVTGEGILYAMWSASLASEAIASGDHMLYDSLWRREYGRDLAEGLRMRSRFYGRRSLELAVRLAGRSPTFGRLIYGMVDNEISGGSYWRALIGSVPRCLAESIAATVTPHGA